MANKTPNKVSIPILKNPLNNNKFAIAKIKGPGELNNSKIYLELATTIGSPTNTQSNEDKQQNKIDKTIPKRRTIRIPNIKRLKQDPELLLTDSSKNSFRGESDNSQYSYAIFEFNENNQITCYPVTPYKFSKESFKIDKQNLDFNNKQNTNKTNNKTNSTSLKELIKNVKNAKNKNLDNLDNFGKTDNKIKKTKLSSAILNKRKRIFDKFQSQTDKTKNKFEDQTAFEVNDTVDKLLLRKQSGLDANQTEETGEFIASEPSDDEGQFDENPMETAAVDNVAFEGYEKEETFDFQQNLPKEALAEKKHLMALLQGKTTNKISRKDNEEDALLSDISDFNDSDEEKNKISKEVAGEELEEKVVRAIKNNEKIGSIDLIRILKIDSSNSVLKKELVLTVKKVAVMKEQGGRKFFELKRFYADKY